MSLPLCHRNGRLQMYQYVAGLRFVTLTLTGMTLSLYVIASLVLIRGRRPVALVDILFSCELKVHTLRLRDLPVPLEDDRRLSAISIYFKVAKVDHLPNMATWPIAGI